MTPSGTITEYPVPYDPTFITAEPDGNLWFTSTSGNEVVKISTAGTVIAQYPVPTGSISNPAGVNDIVVGPNGNLWFTETYAIANQVAEVTTSGAFTEYPVPTANSGPLGITVGPDGNLWFTEAAGNNVAEVTTSGSFTEYPVPTSKSKPFFITVGPNGNLWFTEAAANNVPTITGTVPFANTTGGNFVIGDQSASVGNAVTFWGAQWAKDNSLSGGSTPNSF